MRQSECPKVIAVAAAVACFSIVSGCYGGCGREPRHQDHPAESHEEHHDDQHHDDQHHDDQHQNR
jgi:hypothetical protein